MPINSFEYQLDLLKIELSNIESSIRKIDDLANSTKNWAIVTWMSAMAVLLGDAKLHGFILITAFPPLLFLLADAHWRKVQRRFIYRMNKISDFVNSDEFSTAFENKSFGQFKVLDPFSRYESGGEEMEQFTSIKRVLKYKTVSLMYLGQSLLSIVVFWALRWQ